ncbi:hypothetical protein [Psychrobacter sp. YP14]|uniref:hypothetical protein n=1 Tax=Psychrobacter sp. YP14 TaxID=2203895 RepID=UPI001D0D9F51|nr:hypothetical protein [Psychrobacter sp. YP14]
MSSIVTRINGLKFLLLATVCATSLSGCYVQPHSQSGLAGQTHATQMQHSDEHPQISGRYRLLHSGAHPANLTVTVKKVGLFTPAKDIKIDITTDSATPPALSASTTDAASSCTYHGSAKLMGQDALHGVIYTAPVSSLIHSGTSSALLDADHSNGLLFFRFKDNVLSIDSNNPQALGLLCQGNMVLKGDYVQID